MLIYILNFISIPIYAIFIRNKKKLVMLLSIQLFLLLALRSETLGTDLATYRDGYTYISSLSFGDMLGRLRLFQVAKLKYPFSFESGYVVVNWIFVKAGLSFHTFLALYAAFVSFSYGHFIYKYSELPWLSFAMFYSLSFFEYSFGILSQTIEKKPISFFGLVALAFTFHRIAILWCFVYFLAKFKIKKSTFGALCLVELAFLSLSPLIYERIITPVLEILGKNKYISVDFAINNFFILIVVIAFLLWSVIDFKKIDKTFSTFFFAFLILLLVEILGLNQDVFARARVIPLCSILILVPGAIKRYRDYKTSVLIRMVVYVCLFGFMIYQLKDSVIVPYVPFWK